MKGRIYTAQKCHLCQNNGDKGILNHVENRGYMQCPIHPEVKWQGPCVVRFGRNHTKRKKTVEDGERHLNFIRVQTDKGTFDQRDWAKNQPLSFLTLREKFVKIKESKGISTKQIRHIERVLNEAGKHWDYLQIKDITDGHIEDFFVLDHGIGNKTLSNWKTVLHDFWSWVVRREKRMSKVIMPEFPDIKYKLGWRSIVSMEDQAKILDEIWKISKEENPRIWLGIKLLSLFPKVRPGELRNIKEGHINLADRWVFFPDPKEGDNGKFIHLAPEDCDNGKFIHLAPEDCELIDSIWNPKGLPDLYFFRHLKSKKGTPAGKQFGPKYLKVWWDKACKNLNIKGVDLYGGTKHSTVTALGQVMTPEQIQRGATGHASDAFKRYMLPDVNEAKQARQAVSKIQSKTEQHLNNILDLKKQSN